MKRAWWFLLLAATCLIWSGQGSAVKFLNRQMGPFAITFVPFYVATLLLLPLLWIGPRRPRPGPRDWGRFILAGVGGQVLAQLGMTWGISRSLASNGAILNLMIPVLTAVLAGILLHERVGRLRVFALALGLLGVALLSLADLRESSFGEMRYLAGNCLILGGCLGSSFYNVYCKGLMSCYRETDILIYSYITASLASLPLLVWAEPFEWRTFVTLDRQSWLAFVFLAAGVYGVSMLLFFYVLQHLDVTVASMAVYLVPLFGVGLAALLLGERMGPAALAGAAIVLAATVLIMKYDAALEGKS